MQIDGSPHEWFEGRGPACTLIVYVDDATTRLLATGFFAGETTEAYMETTRAHLAAHGRPVAYYSDRYGVFRVNKKGREAEPTQFTRALKTLDIEAIHAHSPQAKGRVERANRTLQDRLVKEMRLRGIDGMEAGNAYLPEFMADFNRRFAVAVTVCKAFDGSVTVLHKGRELAVRLLAGGEEAVAVQDEKTVRRRVDRAKAEQQSRPAYKPAPDHPWRRALKSGATAVAAG